MTCTATCPEGGGGGGGNFYPPGDAPTYPGTGPQQFPKSDLNIVICPGKLDDNRQLYQDMLTTLNHELRHAMDYCQHGHPGRNDSCGERLCAEIRANSWSGNCSNSSRPAGESKEECIVRESSNSSFGRGGCADKSIEEVSQQASELFGQCNLEVFNPNVPDPGWPTLK